MSDLRFSNFALGSLPDAHSRYVHRIWETFYLASEVHSHLEFVNSVDLRELHVVVEQSLSDDVQDAQPLCKQQQQNTVKIRLRTFWISLTVSG